MEFSSAIIETFLIEAKELLAKMEEVLLKIEQGDSSQDLINEKNKANEKLEALLEQMFGVKG